MNLNLNANTVECLKEIKNIGGTIYQNICNGTTGYVQWGSITWTEFGLLVLGVLIVIFLLVYTFKN